MTTTTLGTRDQDVRIAKLLGWRVVDTGYFYELVEPGKTIDDHPWLDCIESESEAWSGVPRYSTDIREAGVLLVDLIWRGWEVEEHGLYQSGLLFSLYKENKKGPNVYLQAEGRSKLLDPQAAWADAVSMACLKALEVGDGVD